MNLDRETIMRLLQANREAIRHFGVRRLSLFGSYSRCAARPGSDVDILVEFEKKSFDAYMDLKFFLEEILQAPVDLVIADSLKPRLRDVILRETASVPGL